MSCDDGIATLTSSVQEGTEKECEKFYAVQEAAATTASIKLDLITDGFLSPEGKQLLLKDKTALYLRRGLERPLGPSYTSLDASRPWLIYWMLHAMELLDAFPDDLVADLRSALQTCMMESKQGFGGGFMQFAHTAATYGSVLAICTLGDEESFNMVDRESIYKFFMSVKDECGGFRVQKDGEMDTRGLYTVLAIASILNILTPELVSNCAEFVGRCQTYEGGIGGEPGNEAHGGYAFCGLASLAILNRFDTLNVDAFVDWIVFRQMKEEGGFQGRTNKLVDSCYSFWQGATPAILRKYLGVSVPTSNTSPFQNGSSAKEDIMNGELVFAQNRLQQYILLCCQFVEGGLRDKPGKPRDQYHTCYSLSGLSVAQEGGKVVWGAKENVLKETDPVYNVETKKLKRAMEYFASKPALIHKDLFP